MRRYQKWLSLGLLALTPGITLAGPLNSPQLQQSTNPNPQYAALKQSKKEKGNSNQETANKIASSLKKAKLSGFEIEISVQNGVATLDGMVASRDQRAAAAKAALVPGVHRVDNRLQVSELPPKLNDQTSDSPRRPAGRPQSIRPTNFQGRGLEGDAPAQQAMPPQAMGPMGGPPAGIPSYGQPGGSASHTIYNQPNFPNYAWPSYAQYPNSAAVTYPTQYAASAWPYIGPFYPYPQVPLGWRKAQLEWDDGYWNLNFRPRTDRWWWFLDPKNW